MEKSKCCNREPIQMSDSTIACAHCRKPFELSVTESEECCCDEIGENWIKKGNNPHFINCPCYKSLPPKTEKHICCDGECNHDDCCGKVEENCPNYGKTEEVEDWEINWKAILQIRLENAGVNPVTQIGIIEMMVKFISNILSSNTERVKKEYIKQIEKLDDYSICGKDVINIINNIK